MENKPISQNNASSNEFLTLEDVLDSLKRGKWIILASFLVFLTVSSIYYYLKPDIYSATVKLLKDTGPATLNLFTNNMGGNNARSLGNELEILKSRQFASRVQQAMFDSVTKNPELKKYDLFKIISDSSRKSSILGNLLENRNVNSQRSVDIINISFNALNPDEAAIVANVFAAAYIDLSVTDSRSSQNAVKKFIKSQLDQRAQELKVAENNLQEYMVASKVVTISSESEDAVRKIAETEAKINESKIQIGIYEQQIKAADEELRKLEPKLASASSEGLIDEYTSKLQMEIALKEVERDTRKSRYDPNDKKANNFLEKSIIDQLTQDVENLKKQLNDRIKEAYKDGVPINALERTKSVFESKVKAQSSVVVEQYKIDKFSSQLKDLDKKYQTIPTKNIEYARFQRARISAEELYLILEKKYQEALIAEQQVVSDVKVIDAAIPNYWPVEPNRSRMITIFSFVGILFGLGISITIKKMDNRVHKIEDIEKLGFKILGQIPLEAEPIPAGQLLVKVPVLIQELFRQVAINVSFILNLKKIGIGKLILTTSTVPQEGKTFSAINLANVLTDMGHKVLLIDGDLRRPTIDKNLAISKTPGLTELLSTHKDVIQTVTTSHGNKIDVITAGTIPISPIPLISSVEFQHLLEELKEKYSVIILDTPPSLSVGDVQIYAEFADGIVYVVGAEIANKKEITRQYSLLNDKYGHKLMGALLNQVHEDRLGTKGYYYYYQSHKE